MIVLHALASTSVFCITKVKLETTPGNSRGLGKNVRRLYPWSLL